MHSEGDELVCRVDRLFVLNAPRLPNLKVAPKTNPSVKTNKAAEDKKKKTAEEKAKKAEGKEKKESEADKSVENFISKLTSVGYHVKKTGNYELLATRGNEFDVQKATAKTHIYKINLHDSPSMFEYPGVHIVARGDEDSVWKFFKIKP